MNNGQLPNSLNEKEARLLVEMAQDVDLIKQAVLMLFGSVIDLSNRSGAEKKALTNKIFAAVLKQHKKSWKKRAKRL